MAGGGIMPFVAGGATGMALLGAGDCESSFSDLTAAPCGEPALAMLCGGLGSRVGTCEPDRTAPFGVGAGRWLLCWPSTPAATICFWRSKASLSTVTPGVSELRRCVRLSVTLGFGPPSLMRGPAGSSTLSLASASRAVKCACATSADQPDTYGQTIRTGA